MEFKINVEIGLIKQLSHSVRMTNLVPQIVKEATVPLVSHESQSLVFFQVRH